MSEPEVDRDERILWLAARLWRGHFSLCMKKKGFRWPFGWETSGAAKKEARSEANARRRYLYELAAEIIDQEDEREYEEAWSRTVREPDWRITDPKHDPPIPGESRPAPPLDFNGAPEQGTDDDTPPEDK
jgi:hypothetical protein